MCFFVDFLRSIEMGLKHLQTGLKKVQGMLIISPVLTCTIIWSFDFDDNKPCVMDKIENHIFHSLTSSWRKKIIHKRSSSRHSIDNGTKLIKLRACIKGTNLADFSCYISCKLVWLNVYMINHLKAQIIFHEILNKLLFS